MSHRLRAAKGSGALPLDRLGGDYYDAYAIPADMDPAAGDAEPVIEIGEFIGLFEAYGEGDDRG